MDTVGIYLGSTTTGLGDSICGVYAACGLANTGRLVNYYCRNDGWLTRVSHPGVTVLPQKEIGADMGVNYDFQRKTGSERKQWYADMAAAGLNIPRFPIAVPAKIDTTVHIPRTTDLPYVLIAPYSHWAGREWPANHWRRLAEILRSQGYNVAAVGTAADQSRISETFGSLPKWMKFFFGMGADFMTDLILGASCVIGNDSGIAHVAGLLWVPTIAIHSHLSPSILWGHTQILPIVPGTACQFCNWDYAKGFTSTCNTQCTELAGISPHRVAAAVAEVVRPITTVTGSGGSGSGAPEGPGAGSGSGSGILAPKRVSPLT